MKMVVPLMQLKTCRASQMFCNFFFEIIVNSGEGIILRKVI